MTSVRASRAPRTRRRRCAPRTSLRSRTHTRPTRHAPPTATQNSIRLTPSVVAFPHQFYRMIGSRVGQNAPGGIMIPTPAQAYVQQRRHHHRCRAPGLGAPRPLRAHHRGRAPLPPAPRMTTTHLPASRLVARPDLQCAGVVQAAHATSFPVAGHEGLFTVAFFDFRPGRSSI